MGAANCVYVNGYVLHCSEFEYPESYAAFQAKFGDKGVPLDNREFDKLGGTLSSRVRLMEYDYLFKNHPARRVHSKFIPPNISHPTHGGFYPTTRSNVGAFIPPLNEIFFIVKNQ